LELTYDRTKAHLLLPNGESVSNISVYPLSQLNAVCLEWRVKYIVPALEFLQFATMTEEEKEEKLRIQLTRQRAVYTHMEQCQRFLQVQDIHHEHDHNHDHTLCVDQNDDGVILESDYHDNQVPSATIAGHDSSEIIAKSVVAVDATGATTDHDMHQHQGESLHKHEHKRKCSNPYQDMETKKEKDRNDLKTEMRQHYELLRPRLRPLAVHSLQTGNQKVMESVKQGLEQAEVLLMKFKQKSEAVSSSFSSSARLDQNQGQQQLLVELGRGGQDENRLRN
jgi:hypothetical protein